jgi:hypothetical protein
VVDHTSIPRSSDGRPVNQSVEVTGRSARSPQTWGSLIRL